MSVTVSRTYNFHVNATSITLDTGGAGIAWSSAGITALLAVLNDGTPHFLATDFENISGTTWRLKTSMDGASFVDQGTSVGLAVATIDTDPSVTMSNTSGNAFVDELAMWAGHTEFTTTELSRLFDLANTQNLGLDQFTNQTSDINIASDPTGAGIAVSPNDNNAAGAGNTPFVRNYTSDTKVTLTAPATSNNRLFAGWRNNGGDTLSLSRSFVLTVTAAVSVTAHYEAIGDSRADNSVASP